MSKNSKEQTKKILVIDDDEFILEFVRIVLSKEGYEIITAVNGQEGWELAVKEIPDIIISDLMMPIMDGIELCKKVRSEPILTETLFLVLSAKKDVNARIELLNAGADDFIVKPISKDELIAKINAFLRIQNLQMELNEKNLDLKLLRKELNETKKNLKNINKNIIAAQKSDKLATGERSGVDMIHEMHAPLDTIKNNLLVLNNYITDIKALISQYELISDDVSRSIKSNTNNLIRNVDRFKKQIDLESILPDLDNIIEESVSTIDFMKKCVANSEMVSNVELN